MTTIYYFTGTGNSLAVAKGIAEQLGETDLIPIPSLMQADGVISAPAGKVGIICPVYDSGIPVMVRDFFTPAQDHRFGVCFCRHYHGRDGGCGFEAY